MNPILITDEEAGFLRTLPVDGPRYLALSEVPTAFSLERVGLVWLDRTAESGADGFALLLGRLTYRGRSLLAA